MAEGSNDAWLKHEVQVGITDAFRSESDYWLQKLHKNTQNIYHVHKVLHALKKEGTGIPMPLFQTNILHGMCGLFCLGSNCSVRSVLRRLSWISLCRVVSHHCMTYLATPFS